MYHGYHNMKMIAVLGNVKISPDILHHMRLQTHRFFLTSKKLKNARIRRIVKCNATTTSMESCTFLEHS